MKSTATTVQQYLDELPDDRRQAIETVRKAILKNLPEGYEEAMNWGMISYQVPLTVYPETYNKQPLMYAALGSQKNYMAVYMTGLYADTQKRENFIQDYEATGCKLDMGGGCVRFKKLENLPVDVIGKYIAMVPMTSYISLIENLRTTKTKK